MGIHLRNSASHCIAFRLAIKCLMSHASQLRALRVRKGEEKKGKERKERNWFRGCSKHEGSCMMMRPFAIRDICSQASCMEIEAHDGCPP